MILTSDLCIVRKHCREHTSLSMLGSQMRRACAEATILVQLRRRPSSDHLPLDWSRSRTSSRRLILRETCQEAGLAYVAIISCDFPVILQSGSVIRADQAVKDAVFERCSCDTGSRGGDGGEGGFDADSRSPTRLSSRT